MTFTRVANLQDVPVGTGRCFDVNGKKIAVFRKEAECLAIDDTCTHMGASLSEGEVEGDNVVCPWHAALFSLRSGAAAGPPARGGVKAYACRVTDGGIEIDA